MTAPHPYLLTGLFLGVMCLVAAKRLGVSWRLLGGMGVAAALVLAAALVIRP